MNPSSWFGADGESSLQVLWEDGERVFCRRERHADNYRALAVLPVAEHPTPATLDRFAREYGLKDELDGAWAVRPLELVRENAQIILVLEDSGSEPLHLMLGAPMEVQSFLRIAIAVAAALTQVHRRGLVHKDIKPSNILVNRKTGEVKLTGFGIASRLPRERLAPAPPESIAGTLAYMAPEQTGRMNRSTDARSDLYALGVTLYQMLTGALPFTAAEPIEWVHCHIARKPVPPSERLETVPAAISALILKLLAKNAEERYQTAAGLERDLRRCLAAWEAHHRIDAFPLGQQDASDRLLIPEKLYGREREIETLLAAFNRVVASGRPELMLVSGYSGIGKSAVVNELHKALVPRRGLFASGKFDQYKRDIPYATLAQAFESLIRALLGKSETELAGWRDALREALGPNGRLMTDVVPELKLLIGEPPPVPDLPPQQAQGRFHLAFRRFIAVFARPEHPLALFLDDLQWLDSATLDLLEDLLTQPDVKHLMLVGAFRDNEVDSAHPLMRKLEAIRNAGARVREIILAPLACEDLGRLLANSLHGAPERVAPLAQLIHDKTAGNPFFAIQFVSALAEEALLTFDHGEARWSWNLNRIHAKGYTDNVVDLMVGKLNRLPAETQKGLQQLACMGNSADFALLTMVYEDSKGDMHGDLWEAVRTGLVLRFEGAYRFLHDRVQEAAYSLIPEDRRASAHLRIGRLLAAHTPPDKREETIFEIVNQLNQAGASIGLQDERYQLAEFNLIAGKRAKASTAHASALKYLTAGAALLADDCWERRHELAFSLEINRAECEFLTGELAAAEQRLAALSTRAASTAERASVASLRVDLYVALDQSSGAVAVGLDYLRYLGIEWSPHPTKEEAHREYERVWTTLGDRPIEAIVELPLMSDPASLAIMDVLTKLAAPFEYTDANLLSLAICRMVNLSLERGNSDRSCFAYVWLGVIAGPHFGNYKDGFRFGRLGYELVEERGLNRFPARTYMCFGNFVLPWTRHIRAGRDLVRRAFEAANKDGDLTYASYCGNQLNTNLLAAGDPLVDVQREAEHGLAFAQKARFAFGIDLVITQLGLIRTLRGFTPTFGCFDDEQFDEVRIERRFSENPDLAFGECWYWIRKLQARFFAGDYTGALDASSRAQRLLWTSPSKFETAEYHFYGALSQAAFCASGAAGQRRQHVEALVAHHRQLEIWTANCPDNFENRAALVGAEIARIEGRNLDAERLYEEAIRSARANGFVQNEALANELASRFYAARGFEKIARVYLQDARYGYLRWGADGKVRQLDRLYPSLATPETLGPMTNIGSPAPQFDVATVVKASQAVSSEIVLSKLIERLMTIAIENAGADHGLLILTAEDSHLIQAEARAAGDRIEVVLCQKPITGPTCPESVVRYAIRTRESVILDDASKPNLFSGDDYLRSRQTKSILCLPLIKQGELTGLLYLENTLTSYAFPPDRIAILELLAAQAAISLENTRLYSDLQEREAKVRRLVESNIIGISIFDFGGRIIEANEAFLHIVGHSGDDIVSGRLRWTDLTPTEWQHADERAVAELRATGSCKAYEKEYLRNDGSRVPVLVGPAAFDGARDQGVAFVLDLTERKRAEVELRESEQNYRMLFESIDEGFCTIEVLFDENEKPVDYRFLQINPSFERQTGIKNATGRRMREIAPQHEEHWFEVYGRIALTGEPMRFENEAKQLGRWYDVYAFRVEDLKPRRVGILFNDITERKRAESEARDSERRYREAQAELAHVTRVTTLGELTASIAHEVNQPLAGVVANAEAGLHWLRRGTPDVDAACRSLEWIIDDGNRASEVIRRVRSLANKTSVERLPLHVNDVVGEIIPLVQRELIGHQVLLRMELAPALPIILADRVQLQQVIINLVMNGIEAMQSVTDRPRELVIRSDQDETQQVLISVTDCGVGISTENADRLFTPFFTTKSSGMGMGLSICRSIIEAHGGRLLAEANLPQGATFHFTLPAYEAP
jgi:PAS domain S-box-containing protein